MRGIGNVGVAFAPPIAGGRHAHQARIHGVLHVALENAVLDQHIALAGVAAYRHEKTRGADRILCIAADDAEIRDRLALVRHSHAGSGLLDDAHDLVAWGERQWPLEVWIAAAPDQGIGKAGAGGNHLDANLARAGVGNGRLFREFQDLGAAEPGDTDMLPRH